MKTNLTVSVVTILVAALALPAAAIERDVSGVQSYPSASPELVCHDKGELFVLPKGVTWSVSEDLVIDRDCDIHILGNIIAEPGSGASITLQAGRRVTVTGALIAGSGRDGTTATDSLDGGLADAGSDGGSILIAPTEGTCDSDSDCPPVRVTVGPDALLIAGDGGKGGDATAHRPVEGPCPSCAIGGDGGRGGSVIISADEVDYLGFAQPGRGGEGGSAVTTAPAGVAVGGMGGDAGMVYTQGMPSIAFLTANTMSIGGDGGVASALPLFCNQPRLSPLCGEDGNDDPQACSAPDTTSDANLQTASASTSSSWLGLLDKRPSIILLLSDGGLDRKAAGGDGGFGVLQGGHGGDAHAQACKNVDKGEPGKDGENAAQECDGPIDPVTGGPTCRGRPAGPGEAGEEGPPGGNAYATGGNGGGSYIRAGNGGYATAIGGMGGQGGTGGKGGDAHQPVSCDDGGRGGAAGKGGRGGDAEATGGDGGDAPLWGTRGEATVHEGKGGSPGEPGEGGKKSAASPSFGHYIGVNCSSDQGHLGHPGGRGDSGSPNPKPGKNGNFFLDTDGLLQWVCDQLPSRRCPAVVVDPDEVVANPDELVRVLQSLVCGQFPSGRCPTVTVDPNELRRELQSLVCGQFPSGRCPTITIEDP